MSKMQPPRRYPYVGYLMFAMYVVVVALNVTFLVIYANRTSVAYHSGNYSETVFQVCLGIVFAVVFKFLLQFGRFAFFTQPVPEV